MFKKYLIESMMQTTPPLMKPTADRSVLLCPKPTIKQAIPAKSNTRKYMNASLFIFGGTRIAAPNTANKQHITDDVNISSVTPVESVFAISIIAGIINTVPTRISIGLLTFLKKPKIAIF